MEPEKFIDSSNYSCLVSSVMASPVTNDNLRFLLTASNVNARFNNTKKMPFDEKISLDRDGVEKLGKISSSKSNIFSGDECGIHQRLKSRRIRNPNVVITNDSGCNLDFIFSHLE
jgi:hypothetical protein